MQIEATKLIQKNGRKKEFKTVKILKTEGDGWIEEVLLKTIATEGKVGEKKAPVSVKL